MRKKFILVSLILVIVIFFHLLFMDKNIPYIENYTSSSILTTHTFYNDSKYRIIDDDKLILFSVVDGLSDYQLYDTPISFAFDEDVYLVKEDVYGTIPSFDKDICEVVEKNFLTVGDEKYSISFRDDEIIFTTEGQCVIVGEAYTRKFIKGVYDMHKDYAPLVELVGYNEQKVVDNYGYVNDSYEIRVLKYENDTSFNKYFTIRNRDYRYSNFFFLSQMNDELYFINRNGKGFSTPRELIYPLFEWNSFYGDILYSYNPETNELNNLKEFKKELIIRYENMSVYTIDRSNNLYRYNIGNLSNKEKIHTIPINFNCIENCKDLIVFYNYEKLDDNEYRHHLVSVFDTTTDTEIDLYSNIEK